MPEIIANTTDGNQNSGIVSAGTGWSTAHDAVGFLNPATTQTSTSAFGPRVEFSTNRGGIYYIVRNFFDFDLSSITDTITEATFSAMTSVNGGHDAIVVKSGHDPSTTTDDWFSTWLTGQSITLSGWDTGDVTAYSSNHTVAGNGSFTDYTLNSDAITQLNSIAGTSTKFKIALLNYDHDYLNVDPNNAGGSSNLQRTGIVYANHGTSASRPHLNLTTGTAAYGNNVNGVSIERVNGIAAADIEKISGI